MLLARPIGTPARPITPQITLDSTPWIDLIDPTDDDMALASEKLNLFLPSRLDLEEIESSSRYYERDGTLYLSGTPLRRLTDGPVMRPIGLILTDRRLITIRYADYSAFDQIGHQWAEQSPQEPSPSPAALLTELIEEFVNRLADSLENVSQFASYFPPRPPTQSRPCKCPVARNPAPSWQYGRSCLHDPGIPSLNGPYTPSSRRPYPAEYSHKPERSPSWTTTGTT